MTTTTEVPTETVRQRIEREDRERQERNRLRSEVRKQERNRLVNVISVGPSIDKQGKKHFLPAGARQSLGGRKYTQDITGSIRRVEPKKFRTKKERRRANASS